MAKSITENFKEFTAATQSYIDSTIKYHKLDLYKKSVKGAIKAVHVLGMVFFLLLSLLFLSVALSIWLGELIGSEAGGYLIVGGIYLGIFLIVLLFLKPWITKKMLYATSKSLFGGNEDIKIKKYEDVQELRGD